MKIAAIRYKFNDLWTILSLCFIHGSIDVLVVRTWSKWIYQEQQGCPTFDKDKILKFQSLHLTIKSRTNFYLLNLARVVKSQLLLWQLPTMFLIYVPPPFFPTLSIKISPSSCSVCTLFCGMKTCGKELEFKWFLV